MAALLATAAALPAQGLDVAVLGADSSTGIADVKATLLADSRVASADEIDVVLSTPTLATLLNYDVAIVWRRQPSVYSDATALGDVLADYVGNGGGVVEAYGSGHFSSALMGNWNGFYNCSNPNAFSPFTGTYSMGAVSVPTHPIMAGVNNFSTGPNAYYNAGAPMSWTTTIASYTTGTFLVAENTNSAQVVYLNFFPVAETVGPEGYALAGDGALMVQNAVAYVGPSAPTGPQLVASGSAGGSMSFDFSNCTAGAQVAVVYGPAGQYVVPGGPCAALSVDVQPVNFPPVSALILLPIDPSGNANLTRNVPAAAAGLSVQGVDIQTCGATNAVVIP